MTTQQITENVFARGPVAAVSGIDDTLIATISRGVDPAGHAVVLVDGDLDPDTAPLLRAALVQTLNESPLVHCHLHRTEFLGAAGVRALLDAHDHAARAGHALVVRGAHGLARRILRIAEADRVLTLAD